MSSLAPMPDILSLLYNQHRVYTAELGRTHQVLSKLYKRIAKVEKVLAEREREERDMTRTERKKLQWTRVRTKQTINSLEMQQANLHDALRQSNDLITSYGHAAYSSPIMHPWTGHCTPPSPYLFSPLSPAFDPYTSVVQHGPGANDQIRYWDLSSLPERQSSLSPYGSRSADSGFHEPQILGLDAVTEGESLFNAQHVYTREVMSRPKSNASSMVIANADDDDNQTDYAGRGVGSPMTRLGASDTSSSAALTHKRSISANAVLSDLGNLASPSARRGTSVGPVPDRREKTPARWPDGEQQ